MDQVQDEAEVAKDVDHPYVYSRADEIVNRWMTICALLIAFMLGVMALEHYRIIVRGDLLLTKTTENNTMLREVMAFIRGRLMEEARKR